MKIEKFDAPTVEMLCIEIEMAIAKVCADYGLKPTKLGNITFSPKFFSTSKLLFSIEENLDFAAMGTELVGMQFKERSTNFIVIENLVAEKCVRLKTTRGKIYRATYDQLKRMTKIW